MSVSPISANAFSASATAGVQAHHHHGLGGARKAGMDAAASALGMSSSDLQSALRGGQTLSSLAQSKGISTTDLTNTISSALTKTNPSLSADRAQQLAQRMISGPGAAPASGAGQAAPAAGGPNWNGTYQDGDGR